jgi:hypothetical protein
LPWLTPDEVQTVLDRKDGEDMERFNQEEQQSEV